MSRSGAQAPCTQATQDIEAAGPPEGEGEVPAPSRGRDGETQKVGLAPVRNHGTELRSRPAQQGDPPRQVGLGWGREREEPWPAPCCAPSSQGPPGAGGPSHSSCGGPSALRRPLHSSLGRHARGGDGAVALLARRVPDLRLDGLAVHLDAARGEFHADGALALQVELVAGETRQQVALAHARVPDEHHLRGAGRVRLSETRVAPAPTHARTHPPTWHSGRCSPPATGQEAGPRQGPRGTSSTSPQGPRPSKNGHPSWG